MFAAREQETPQTDLALVAALVDTARTVTLLVALKGKDGLVLAADSRDTFGDPRGVTAQNDSQQKAHVLAPHVAALQAGAGEVGALIVQNARQGIESQGLDGATAVMEHLRASARSAYNEWFPSVPAIQPPALQMAGQVAARPDLAFLVGGYEDGPSGPQARIYQIGSATDFSPMLHDYGWAVSGVAQYALYLLNLALPFASRLLRGVPFSVPGARAGALIVAVGTSRFWRDRLG